MLFIYLIRYVFTSGTFTSEANSLNPYKQTTSRFGEPTASIAMNSGKLSDEQHAAVERMLTTKAPEGANRETGTDKGGKETSGEGGVETNEETNEDEGEETSEESYEKAPGETGEDPAEKIVAQGSAGEEVAPGSGRPE